MHNRWMVAAMLHGLMLFAFAVDGCDVGTGLMAPSADPEPISPDASTDSARVTDTALPWDDRLPPTERGSASPDAASDVRRIPSRALAMRPETCGDERLALPDGFARFGEPSVTLWHLCYATPSSDTSSSPFATQESQSVTFTVRSSWTGVATDLIRIPSDDTNVRWMASALISVPNAPAAYPLLNARNQYDAARLWALGADETGHTLETHGTLQAWRVMPDRRRIPVPLRPIVSGCLDELMPEVLNGASFLPDGERCPEEYYLCAPGRFHCDYEP